MVLLSDCKPARCRYAEHDKRAQRKQQQQIDKRMPALIRIDSSLQRPTGKVCLVCIVTARIGQQVCPVVGSSMVDIMQTVCNQLANCHFVAHGVIPLVCMYGVSWCD